MGIWDYNRRIDRSADAAKKQEDVDSNGVSSNAHSAVAATSNWYGEPLPSDLKRKYEGSLGADLSDVRVHRSASSQTAAKAVGAKAYTVGQDIHFGEGQYNPSSAEGEHLLAHEVAHTVQQQGGIKRLQLKDIAVSRPTDSHEVEADAAADAMLAGKPASVAGAPTSIARQPLIELPGTAPLPVDFADVELRSKLGVPYKVPALDYHSQVASVALPPFDKPMPASSIPDPGNIPGWRAVMPEQKLNAGPIEMIEPAKPCVIAPNEHATSMKDAWEQYRTELLPAVQQRWNDDARPKIDSFTQQKQATPEIQQLLDTSKSHLDIPAPKVGKGTLTDQAMGVNVTAGKPTTLGAADKQVAAGGQGLLDDAKASAGQSDESTVPGPVKKAVNAVNAKRLAVRGFSGQLIGASSELASAQDKLSAAYEEIQTAKAPAEKDEKDPVIAAGLELANAISPKLGSLVKTLLPYYRIFEKLKTTAEKTEKAVTKLDPGAAHDAIVSLVDATKLVQLQVEAGRVAEIAGDKPAFKKVVEVAKHVESYTQTVQGIASNVESALMDEKAAYDALAEVLTTPGNWKGKDAGGAQAAANAMHGLPVAKRLLMTLQNVRDTMPVSPVATTKQSQGYALATQGVPPPGAQQLQQTAGWIDGAQGTIDVEIGKFRALVQHFESLAGAMGIE